MRAKEMISSFAEWTGENIESVKVADRALAEAGMRAKGRGPKPPEVSRQDVIRLMLGVAGSRVLSRADEYVSDAVKFTCFDLSVDVVSHADEDTEMAHVLGMTRANLEGANLMSVLMRVCARMAQPDWDGVGARVGGVWLSVEQQGPVTLQFSNENASLRGEAFFTGVVGGMSRSGIMHSATVNPSVLRWIGQFAPETVEETA